MIDTKTTNDKRNENEIILTISDSSGPAYLKQMEKKWIYIVLAMFMIWLIGLYATHVILAKTQAQYKANLNSNDALTSDTDSEYNSDNIKFVTRAQWLARPPEHQLTKLDLPNRIVIIAHTATGNCSTQASCARRVKLMQTFHTESRGWDDIAYNFLVGGDGAVYVGRGWNDQGAHTKGHNRNSICIAFIGTFNKIEPPDVQLNAAKKLIELGIELKKLAPDYKLFGQRQLIPSESPGQVLYEIIQKWPHWTEKE